MKCRNPLKVMSPECVYARFFVSFIFFLFLYESCFCFFFRILASLLFWFGFCHIQSHCSIFICTQYISLFVIIAWLLLSLYFLHVFVYTMSTTMTIRIYFTYLSNSSNLFESNDGLPRYAFTIDIFTFAVHTQK